MSLTEARPGKLSDLEWAEKHHRYACWPRGICYPGTTSIAGLLDNGKANGFAGKAAQITREGRDYKAEWKASGDKGNRVHAHALSWSKGEAIDQLDDEKGYLDALEQWTDTYRPAFVEMERVVLGRMTGREYGGRLDAICVLEDEMWLVDYKTGKSYAWEHTLQLAAYRFATGMAVYLDGELCDELEPLPRIERTGALYLHEDGTYDFTEYPADEKAFAAFLALRKVLGIVRDFERDERERKKAAR